MSDPKHPIEAAFAKARQDLEGVPGTASEGGLRAIAAAESAWFRHRPYPYFGNPNAYCLNCLAQKQPGDNFTPHVPWPCMEAEDIVDAWASIGSKR